MIKWIFYGMTLLIPLSLAVGSVALVVAGVTYNGFGLLESSLLVGLGSMGLLFGVALLQEFFGK